MNLVAQGGLADAVMGDTPRKDGYGIPGVDGVIRSPESLKYIKPATVLIANPVYASEIGRSLSGLNVSADVQPLWH